VRLELGLGDGAPEAAVPALRDEFERRGMPAYARRATRLMGS